MTTQQRKRIIVFSGAGMSAESGIATFRDHGGLWEKFRIEDVATPEAWERDPDLVTNFYNMRRKQLVEASPNAGHTRIASWEREYDVQIITQNIDDLHERAGSSKVMHIHGELMVIKSEFNPRHRERISHWEVTANDRCPQGGRMRPDVVWFGEAVELLYPAAELMATGDIVIIVGTSLQVYPAAGLVHNVRPDAKLIVIDPDLDALPGGVQATMIKSGAVEGLKHVESMF